MTFDPLIAAGIDPVDRDDYVPSRAVMSAPGDVERPMSGTQVANGPDELIDIDTTPAVDIAAESQALNDLLP